MPDKGSTSFVESDRDGMYVAPERNFDRLKMITSHLRAVDQNGFDRPRAKPDDSVTAVVEPTTAGPVPSMATALTAAAAEVGGDLAQLLDSASFCAAVAKISPADSAGLMGAVLDHMPAPAAPTMASNPSQGHIGTSAPGRPTGTFLERMQRQTAKALDQPTPPGSTVV